MSDQHVGLVLENLARSFERIALSLETIALAQKVSMKLALDALPGEEARDV